MAWARLVAVGALAVSVLYLEHMGAIVPMRIDDETRLSGEGVRTRRDLAEGQEVRATFTVRGTTNVADGIEVARASGRSTTGPGVPPVPEY